jgi:predicted Zn-dependent protease
VPGEWAFDYFAGLVKLKRGKAAEALDLIRRSLAADADPMSPSPGERDYILAQALRATGDAKGSLEALHRARVAKGHFGDLARAEAP